MTAEVFLDKLDRFIADTIGKEFEYKYEIEDDGVWFNGFWIMGFDHEEDEDGDYIPEPYPYTHPIREILNYSKIKK